MIMTKVFNTIEEVNSCFTETCSQVASTMTQIVEEQNFSTYDDYVRWALNKCSLNAPSPFSEDFPSCYSLNVGPTYFTIRIPNKFGVGIRVLLGRKNISYEVSILFYNNENIIKESSYYENMIDNGWKVKERS